MVQGLAILVAFWLPTFKLEDTSSLVPRYSFTWQHVLTCFLFGIFYAQAIAAHLFTHFLTHLSNVLERPDLAVRLKQLRRRVWLTSVAGTFLFPLLVGIVYFVITSTISVGFLWSLWLPVVFVILLIAVPFAWLIAIPLLMMWIDYTFTLLEIQNAIMNALDLIDQEPIAFPKQNKKAHRQR